MADVATEKSCRVEGDTPRDNRQATVAAWCEAAFGRGHASSIAQRGIRLLEEAIEAYQATGAKASMAHRLVDYVFSRPVGELSQELGGVGVTLLALAAAAGKSADAAELTEVNRVLAKPIEHFWKRNEAKNAAGFDVTGGYPTGPASGVAFDTEQPNNVNGRPPNPSIPDLTEEALERAARAYQSEYDYQKKTTPSASHFTLHRDGIRAALAALGGQT